MQNTKNKKIILTGGHAATTAIATIESLRDQGFWDIYWVGTKRALEGNNALTLEFRELPRMGIKCYAIISGRIQRKFSRHTIPSLLKIPLGFISALAVILRIRPDVIISYGGSAAFPVVFFGWLLGMPVIIHEQTPALGLANRYSSYFADKVAISRKSSARFIKSKKVILTGNPVRKKFFSINSKTTHARLPVILATGGSRGSRAFNDILLSALPELVKRYKIIHQSGELEYPKCLRIKRSLKIDDRYELMSSIDVDKMPEYYEAADLIIGRSGANTVSEVIASGRPAVFIPIPWSQNNEQVENARIAESSGQAIVLNQETTGARELLNAVGRVFDNYHNMAMHRNIGIYKLDKSASARLAGIAKDFL